MPCACIIKSSTFSNRSCAQVCKNNSRPDGEEKMLLTVEGIWRNLLHRPPLPRKRSICTMRRGHLDADATHLQHASLLPIRPTKMPRIPPADREATEYTVGSEPTHRSPRLATESTRSSVEAAVPPRRRCHPAPPAAAQAALSNTEDQPPRSPRTAPPRPLVANHVSGRSNLSCNH